jgi:hypothetical protein
VFRAPDAESVRVANRKMGVPVASLWTASIHASPVAPPPDPAQTVVLIERSFERPVVFEDILAISDRGAWCMDLHRARHRHSYFSLDRKRMICVYEAADAESVRLAQKQIGMPFTDAWAARFCDRTRNQDGR